MAPDKTADWRQWVKRWLRLPRIFRLLFIRTRLARVYRAAERYRVLFWAGLVGILGGLSSVLFRELLELLSFAFTGQSGGMVAAFSNLPAWQRLLTPALGGVAAGLIIHFGWGMVRSRSAPA